MRFEKTLTITCFFFAYLILLWGCQGSRPIGPEKVISLNVSIPPTGEVKSALIGTAANEILYRVDGAGVSDIHGTIGPFTTPASSGSIGFALDVPGGGFRVLSIQLNNAATHQPLALGAVGLDLTPNNPVTNVIVVEMGSVTRNCYYTDFGGALTGTYAFSGDVLTGSQVLSGPIYDIALNNSGPGISSPLTIQDAQGSVAPLPTIAYLGNGKLVDYDFVPPNPKFFSNSVLAKGSAAQVGDIYCIKLGTIPNGHAWIQVTNTGNGVMYVGPKFIFRINSKNPYYAYERTTADSGNSCSLSW